MKPYDSVEWEFILHCLAAFGVPNLFIEWVRECITTPNLSVALNGRLVGYFRGKKGYLFVIAMDVLPNWWRSLLKKNLKDIEPFKKKKKIQELNWHKRT